MQAPIAGPPKHLGGYMSGVKIMQPAVIELWTFLGEAATKTILGDLRSLGGYPRILSASSL